MQEKQVEGQKQKVVTKEEDKQKHQKENRSFLQAVKQGQTVEKNNQNNWHKYVLGDQDLLDNKELIAKYRVQNNKLPQYFDSNLIHSFDVDMLISEAIPNGLPQAYIKEFCSYIIHLIKQQLSESELELVEGGSFMGGQQAYGQKDCTWRIHFKRDGSPDEIRNLISKLLKDGVNIQIEGMTKIINIPTKAVSKFGDGLKIIKLNRLPRECKNQGFSQEFFENILSKIQGFANGKVLSEFILWNKDWSLNPKELIADETSNYLLVTGVSDDNCLNDKYLQVNYELKKSFTVTCLKGSFIKHLFNLFDDKQNGGNFEKRFENIRDILIKLEKGLEIDFEKNETENQNTNKSTQKNINVINETLPTNMIGENDADNKNNEKKFENPIFDQKNLDIQSSQNNDCGIQKFSELAQNIAQSSEIISNIKNQKVDENQTQQEKLNKKSLKKKRSPSNSPTKPKQKIKLDVQDIEVTNFLEFIDFENISNSWELDEWDEFYKQCYEWDEFYKQCSSFDNTNQLQNCQNFLLKKSIINDEVCLEWSQINSNNEKMSE